MPTAGGAAGLDARRCSRSSRSRRRIVWSVGLDVFAIGVGGALGTVLQTRLMDVAGDAQALAAALNHSAFNTRQRARAVARRDGDRRRLRLDLDRLGRRSCWLLGGLAVLGVSAALDRGGASPGRRLISLRGVRSAREPR